MVGSSGPAGPENRSLNRFFVQGENGQLQSDLHHMEVCRSSKGQRVQLITFSAVGTMSPCKVYVCPWLVLVYLRVMVTGEGH